MKNLAGWLCLGISILEDLNGDSQSVHYLIAAILCFMWSDLTEEKDEC